VRKAAYTPYGRAARGTQLETQRTREGVLYLSYKGSDVVADPYAFLIEVRDAALSHESGNRYPPDPTTAQPLGEARAERSSAQRTPPTS
jgi:hypothetical protein